MITRSQTRSQIPSYRLLEKSLCSSDSSKDVQSPVAIVTPRCQLSKLEGQNETDTDVVEEAKLGQEMGLDRDLLSLEHVDESLIEDAIEAKSQEHYDALIERSNEFQGEHSVIELEIHCDMDFSDEEDHELPSNTSVEILEDNSKNQKSYSVPKDICDVQSKGQADHQRRQTGSPIITNVTNHRDMEPGQNQELRLNPLRRRQNIAFFTSRKPRVVKPPSIARDKTKPWSLDSKDESNDVCKRCNRPGHSAIYCSQVRATKRTWAEVVAGTVIDSASAAEKPVLLSNPVNPKN